MDSSNDRILAVDQCSLYSVFIEAIATDKRDKKSEAAKWGATGFVYQHSGQFYLVSNWHVFSGRHAITRDPLDNNLALPDKIRIHFPIEGKQGVIKTNDYLLNSESDGVYCWMEHPQKNKVDVAVLPISVDSEYTVYPINTINESRGIKNFPTDFYVGQDVFVLGFPLGIKGGGGFPIWKRASIASEPYLPIEDNELKILIDTATREGMSGSPVIVTGNPGSEVLFDGKKQPVNIRSFKLFVGIYSGRITGTDELSAQLGVVWKEQSIREIIEAESFYCETD